MASIEISHPPEALIGVFNPTLRFLLRVPVIGPAMKDFMVLTFTGRKSGKKFAVPVSAHHLDGDLYSIMEANWKHNFAGGRDTDVLYKGKTSPMSGVLIKEPAEVAGIAHRVATEQGPKKAQQTMGIKFDPPTAVPPLDDFVEAASRLGMAAVKLTPR